MYASINGCMNVTKQVRKDFWVRIAWSFVRPNAADGGHVRLDRRLRLQLYKYRAFWFWEKAPDRDSSVCPAYWQVFMHTYIYVYIHMYTYIYVYAYEEGPRQGL
jgi:hypothetical protein